MSEEDLTPELIKIMTEDAIDLSNSLWTALRTYDADNKSFKGRHDVLLNSLTTVSANVLKQLGNDEKISELCAAFWFELLMKLKTLMDKENKNGTEQEQG